MSEKLYEIVSHEWKTNDKGKYLVVTIAGQQKPKNVFGEDAYGGFSGNGKYELTWKKNGVYVNIAGFKKIQDGVVTPGVNGTSTFHYSLDPNKVLEQKADTFRKAFFTAGDLTKQLIASQVIKTKEDASAFALTLTEAICAEAKLFVGGPFNDGAQDNNEESNSNEIIREPIGV